MGFSLCGFVYLVRVPELFTEPEAASRHLSPERRLPPNGLGISRNAFLR
jgi:hypothetical protein